MRVRVRLLGSLRPTLAGRELELELPIGSDASTLIKHITEIYPQLVGMLDVSSSGVLIMLGGVEVGNLQGLETPLSDGLEVVFVPVTHGG